MTDLFHTSRIRDDPAYWDALAERVAANAERGSNESAFWWIVNSRAGWVAATLLLAAALGFMMLRTEITSAKSFSALWARALAPADDVGKAIILRDAPPLIGALLLGGKGDG